MPIATVSAESRETLSPKYYRDCPLSNIAGLFQVRVRTVQRWQTIAEAVLRKKLGEF